MVEYNGPNIEALLAWRPRGEQTALWINMFKASMVSQWFPVGTVKEF
jgi:hypothetical protein